MKGHIFIISGPSGVGKTTLIRKTLKKLQDIHFSCSYTTRPKKKGEKKGEDYYFVSEEVFMGMVKRGELLEWAKVHGYLYGTHQDEVFPWQDQGMDVILDIDVQGAEILRQHIPEGVYIFVIPPSYRVLKERLILRKRDSLEDIQRRLQEAQKEMKHHKHYDYVIINDKLPSAIQTLEAIVISQRHRYARMQPRIIRIIKTFNQEVEHEDGSL